MTSTQRVHQFRARNPDYDRQWKARRQAAMLARVAALQAQAAVRVAQPLLQPVPRPMLMLPAPVRDPAMEAIHALAAAFKSNSAVREPLPVAPSRPSLQTL